MEDKKIVPPEQKKPEAPKTITITVRNPYTGKLETGEEKTNA